MEVVLVASESTDGFSVRMQDICVTVSGFKCRVEFTQRSCQIFDLNNLKTVAVLDVELNVVVAVVVALRQCCVKTCLLSLGQKKLPRCERVMTYQNDCIAA